MSVCLITSTKFFLKLKNSPPKATISLTTVHTDDSTAVLPESLKNKPNFRQPAITAVAKKGGCNLG